MAPRHPCPAAGRGPATSCSSPGPAAASAAGLGELRGRRRQTARQRWRLPTAARWPACARAPSARLGGARAMIDVSDGLALDLHRLADASGVGFDLDDVPVAEGATLDEALGGGEDYELVVAVARRRPKRFEQPSTRPGLRHRPDRRGGRRCRTAHPGRRAPGSAGLAAHARLGAHARRCAARPARLPSTPIASGQKAGRSPGGPSSRCEISRRIPVGAAYRLGDLAGPDARGADVEPLGRPVDQRPHPLDVGVPAPLGAPVGVAHVHAERGLLAADVAH